MLSACRWLRPVVGFVAWKEISHSEFAIQLVKWTLELSNDPDGWVIERTTNTVAMDHSLHELMKKHE
jgi:hypothetical protein